MELKLKGIDKELIDEVLENTEELVHDELEMARKLVEKRIDKLRNLDRQKIYQRLGGFLSRRGFDYDTLKKAIDEVLTKKV